MSTTIEEINAFHRFAVERLGEMGEVQVTLDELLIEWDSFNNRAEINAAIQRGIADADAHRTRPAAAVVNDLKARFKIGE